MKPTCLDGLHFWSAWQPDRRIDFNAFFLPDAGGGVLVDPLAMDTTRIEFVRGQGGAAFILLTNADHWRATTELKSALGAAVLAPAGDRERFGARGALVDSWVSSTEDLPEPLRGRIEVFVLRGGKSPAELALHLKAQGALLFGDLVRSNESGRFALLPEAKLTDRTAALESLRPLLARRFDAVLVGDGDCVFRGGREALFSMLDGLPGVLFNRLNLDRVEMTRVPRHPRSVTEIGELSGAMTCRKLGFHLRRIPPGMLWPAYHHETLEEELFLVRKGRVKVRTPQGLFPLEPGDIVVLCALPAFAHQFVNDGDEPCDLLALSNLADDNISVYPEGGRIMIGARGEMYRVGDQRRDYWEDEPSVR